VWPNKSLQPTRVGALGARYSGRSPRPARLISVSLGLPGAEANPATYVTSPAKLESLLQVAGLLISFSLAFNKCDWSF
jgi:hypothetical protein